MVYKAFHFFFFILKKGKPHLLVTKRLWTCKSLDYTPGYDIVFITLDSFKHGKGLSLPFHLDVITIILRQFPPRDRVELTIIYLNTLFHPLRTNDTTPGHPHAF